MGRADSPGTEAKVLSTLTLELLAWVAARPRTYRETMEVWRTACPRMPIWEDATSEGLVEVLPGQGAGPMEATVGLTPSGRAALTLSAKR